MPNRNILGFVPKTLLYIAYWLAVLGLSFIIWRVVEKPFPAMDSLAIRIKTRRHAYHCERPGSEVEVMRSEGWSVGGIDVLSAVPWHGPKIAGGEAGYITQLACLRSGILTCKPCDRPELGSSGGAVRFERWFGNKIEDRNSNGTFEEVELALGLQKPIVENRILTTYISFI
jgi:hypothetical protein